MSGPPTGDAAAYVRREGYALSDRELALNLAMTTTKAPPDPNHPIEVAKREANRPHPGALAEMRSLIMRAWGFVIDTNRLEPEEAGELYTLHRKALERESWEQSGPPFYLLSRLDVNEHRRWRALVSKAAGEEGLLDRLDDDAATARKIRELAAAALTPVPTKTAAPAGSVVLPSAVWEDVVAGRLLPIDVCVLAAVLFLFQGGGLHPKVEKRRDAAWAPDATLFVQDGLHRLLPQWSQVGLHVADAVSVDRTGIGERLGRGGWLTVERQGRQLAVRSGSRLAGQPARRPL
jgi:hypothetical protein